MPATCRSTSDSDRCREVESIACFAGECGSTWARMSEINARLELLAGKKRALRNDTGRLKSALHPEQEQMFALPSPNIAKAEPRCPSAASGRPSQRDFQGFEGQRVGVLNRENGGRESGGRPPVLGAILLFELFRRDPGGRRRESNPPSHDVGRRGFEDRPGHRARSPSAVTVGQPRRRAQRGRCRC